MLHEAMQDDGSLFERLCPAAKDGSRRFAPVMLRRLRKLGREQTHAADEPLRPLS